MFDFFKKKTPAMEAGPDQVFLSDRARAEALAVLCREARRRVVLVTPFAGHVAGLKAALERRGVEVELPSGSYREGAGGQGAPLLGDQAWFERAVSSLRGEVVELVQVERHPLRAHDLAVQRAAAALGAGSRMRVLLSLEDGLFELFGGSVGDLCRRLGMGEEEAIEHALVSKAVENAQVKLAARVQSEQPADSFARWRSLNLGPKVP